MSRLISSRRSPTTCARFRPPSTWIWSRARRRAGDEGVGDAADDHALARVRHGGELELADALGGVAGVVVEGDDGGPGRRLDPQIPLVHAGLDEGEGDRVGVAEGVVDADVERMGVADVGVRRQVGADRDLAGLLGVDRDPVEVDGLEEVRRDHVLVGERGVAAGRQDDFAGGVGRPRLQVVAGGIAEEAVGVLGERAGAGEQELVAVGGRAGGVDDEEAVAGHGEVGLGDGRLQQALHVDGVARPRLHAAGGIHRRRRLLGDQGLERHLGVLVADGVDVGDVVGDGTHGAALGAEGRHAGSHRTEQAHRGSPAALRTWWPAAISRRKVGVLVSLEVGNGSRLGRGPSMTSPADLFRGSDGWPRQVRP